MAEEAATNLSAAFGKLTNAAGAAINAGTGLAGALLTGKQNLGDYSTALASNTDLLGKHGKALANLINGLVQFAEGSLQEYQALTGIGATFGKEMTSIKVSAAELGLTVEEMIGFFKENNEGLRAFGGTTDIAIARFKAFSKEVLDSQVGTELRRLGYTASDINDGLALFGEVTARNNRNETMSLTQQADAAQDLMVEMDALSKLTGKQRSQLADEMKERRRQGDIAAFLAGKTAEEQTEFTSKLIEIQNKLGQNAADAFVDLTLRGAPTTEQTRGALLAMGGGADELYAAAQAFNSGNINEFNSALDSAIGSAVDYQKTEEFRNAAILGGINSTTSAFADASAASYNYQNTLDGVAGAGESAAEVQARLDTQIKEEQFIQMQTQTGILDKTIQLQESVRQMTVMTMQEAMPRLENAALHAIEKVESALPTSEEIAAQVGGAIDRLFDAASGKADGVMNGIMDFFNGFDQNLGDKQDSTTEAVKEMGGNVETASEIQSEENAELKEAVAQAEEAVANAKANLADLQAQQTQMTQQGFTHNDAAMKSIMEQVESAKAELLQATNQAFTAQKVSRFNQGGFFSGGFAEGGTIGAGKFGLVGEAGPEFVSGPAQVMSANTSMGVMQNLMKGIKELRTTVQESNTDTQNVISNSNSNTDFSVLADKMDTLNGLVKHLIHVESQAGETGKRALRATKGLSGNMMKGVM